MKASIGLGISILLLIGAAKLGWGLENAVFHLLAAIALFAGMFAGVISYWLIDWYFRWRKARWQERRRHRLLTLDTERRLPDR